MPEGPLGGPRPFSLGPFVTEDEDTSKEEQSNIETETTDGEEIEENPDDINLEEINDKTTRAVLKMANDWYESITRDQSKHNMMKHYLQGVTELSDDEIEKILEKAGI